MSVMSLIQQEKAPRPTRRSFSRSVYDAIHSNAGASTLDEIIQLIPATDDANKWQTATPDRVTQILKSSEQHGYVQHNPDTDRWSIATLTWYEKMQEHVKDLRAASDALMLGDSDRPAQAPIASAPSPSPSFIFTPRVVVWALVIGWAIGVMTALAFVGLRSIGGL